MGYIAPAVNNINFQLTSGYTNPPKDSLYFPQQPFIFPPAFSMTGKFSGTDFWGDIVKPTSFSITSTFSVSVPLQILTPIFNVAGAILSKINIQIGVPKLTVVGNFSVGSVKLIIIVTPSEFKITNSFSNNLQINLISEFTSINSFDSSIYFELGTPSFISTNNFSTNFVGTCILDTGFTTISTIKGVILGVGVFTNFTSSVSITVSRIYTYNLVGFNINSNLGTDENIKNLFGIADSHQFLIKNQYGTYLESFLGILNEVKGVYENKTSQYIQALNNKLLLNDPLSNIQLIKSSFELLTSYTSLFNTITEGFEGHLNIVNKLNFNDSLISDQLIKSSSELISSRQNLINIITEGFEGHLNIVNKLNFNDSLISDQLIKSSFELLTSNNLITNIISEGKNDKQSILNILSFSIQQNQRIVNDVSNLSDLLKSFLIKNSMYKIPPKFYSYDVKIYLDGTNISEMVSSDITIEKDQGNIHNSISFSSISETLFNKADPSVSEGEIRIEVQIDSTVMYFLLEERSFDSDGTVSYWGRDATARDNSPWTSSMSVTLYEWQSAKELCESLVSYSAIDWEILDWTLPDTFETTGTPIEIISEIVSELGAIVKSQDDGSLLVRYSYPIRPVNVKTSQAVYSYTSDMVYDENFTEEIGDWYNMVTVTADTADKTAPILELEDVADDGDRTIGLTSYIRAFYYEDPNEALSTTSQDTTDGIITFIEKNVEEITEIITFSDGTGSSSYPLKTLNDISWLGRTNTISTWDEYSTDITLETESYCLAEITYDSEYYRYKASKHSVEELLTIFEIESTYYSSILVKTEAIDYEGDKEGDEITTAYLTNECVLVKRGENWIDDNKYNTKTISFNSPYIPSVENGNIIWLDINKIPPGNYQVISNGITIDGPKVINNMVVKQWEI